MLFVCGGGNYSPFRDIAENLRALFTDAYYWEDDCAWAAREYQQSRYDSVDSRGDIIYSSDEGDEEGTYGSLRTYNSDDSAIEDKESSLENPNYLRLATAKWRPRRECKVLQSSSHLPEERRIETRRLIVSRRRPSSRLSQEQQPLKSILKRCKDQTEPMPPLPVSSEPISCQEEKQESGETNRPRSRRRKAQTESIAPLPVSSEPMPEQTKKDSIASLAASPEPVRKRAKTESAALLLASSEPMPEQMEKQHRNETNKPNPISCQVNPPSTSAMVNFRPPKSLLALSRTPMSLQGEKDRRVETNRPNPLSDHVSQPSSSAMVSFRAPNSLLALSRDPIQASAASARAMMVLVGFTPSLVSRKSVAKKEKAQERQLSPTTQFFKPQNILAFATVLRIMVPNKPAHTALDMAVRKMCRWALSSPLLRPTFQVPKCILPIPPRTCEESQDREQDNSAESSRSTPDCLMQDIDSTTIKGRE